jgi:hypothetical protein
MSAAYQHDRQYPHRMSVAAPASLPAIESAIGIITIDNSEAGS